MSEIGDSETISYLGCFDAILATQLGIEAIHFGACSTLMIPPQEEDG